MKPCFRLLSIALALLAAALTGIAQAEAPSVHIADSDPGLSAELGNYAPLYLHLEYRSDKPVRFGVEALSGGRRVAGRNGGMPVYPAGSGEAIAWIGYPGGSTVDTLRISIQTQDWHDIAAVDIPVQLHWLSATVPPRAHPAWVARLNAARERAERAQPKPFDSAAMEWLGSAIMLAAPAYALLQLLLAFSWAGRWRIAALMPLIAIVPAVLFSLYALADGSNLWPITVILLAPFAFVYLVVVWLARRVIAFSRGLAS